MKTSDLLMGRPIKCPTSRQACSVYPTWIVWWSPAGGAWASGLAWEAVPCYLFTPCFAHEVAQSSLELSYSVTPWTRDIILWSRHGESQTHLDVYIQPDNWQHIHRHFHYLCLSRRGRWRGVHAEVKGQLTESVSPSCPVGPRRQTRAWEQAPSPPRLLTNPKRVWGGLGRWRVQLHDSKHFISHVLSLRKFLENCSSEHDLN